MNKQNDHNIYNIDSSFEIDTWQAESNNHWIDFLLNFSSIAYIIHDVSKIRIKFRTELQNIK